MLSSVLPFLIAGAVTGSLYGLAATGLVLTYKTSGIFNFAHGAIGAAAAFFFYDLHQTRGVPWPIASFVAVGVMAPLLGLALAAFAARLATASTARRVVATVGVLLAVQGAVQLRYGIVPRPFRSPLPTDTLDILGTAVGYDQIITSAIALVVLVALGCLFRLTLIGLQMRAVVDNTELLDLAGGNPTRVRALSWMIGSAFAALTGLLFAPQVGLDSVLLTLLVVQAFGAAAVGRFTNLTATFLGGVAIGLVQGLLRAPDVRDLVPLVETLQNLDQAVSFLVLFGVLLLSRRGIFAEPTVVRPPRPVRRLDTRTSALLLVSATVVVGVVPHVASSRMPVFMQAAVFVTIFASLHLLVEVSGQVSLCHAVFVAVGAASFAHLTTGAGLPWLVGALVAGLVAVPIGAMVAIPAIRVSGLFLALATLGFGIVAEQMAFNRAFMFGDLGSRTGARPAALGLDGDAAYFYLCAGIAASAIALVVVLRRVRLGRLLQALADSPVALATHGASVNVIRLLVFCIAAYIAALGGALYVGVVGSVSSSGVSPAALISVNSLLWVAVLAISGRSPIAGPIWASMALFVVPAYLTVPNLPQYLTIAFGVTALLVASLGDDAAKWLASRSHTSVPRVARSPVAERTAKARVGWSAAHG